MGVLLGLSACHADPAPADAACTPTCNGDKVAACTAAGETQLISCELGCVDAPTPHCGYLEPKYLPDVCKSPATSDLLSVAESGGLDPDVTSNCNGGVVEQPGAPGICVVRYRRIRIEEGATLTVIGKFPVEHGSWIAPGRSIAFVADEELRVDGVIDVGARGQVNGPGGGVVTSGGCAFTGNGGGGAGGKTTGGAGGSKTEDGGAMNGGTPVGDPGLRSTLVGGAVSMILTSQCSSPEMRRYVGGGGGALALVACRGHVDIAGTLNAGGGGGEPGSAVEEGPIVAGHGGGAGGLIALQGIEISVTGRMFANGGGGGAGSGDQGMDGQMSATEPARGGAPIGDDGAGGDGGVGMSPPSDGKRVLSSGFKMPGGGGGSVGFFQTFMPAGRSPALTPSAISPEFEPNGVIMIR